MELLFDRRPPSGGWIDRRFLDTLVQSARGRTFLLDFLRSAEESDEAAIFETLAARVDDPDLHKLVRVHRADEERHARLLRRAIERVSANTRCPPPPPPPPHDDLRVARRLDDLLGGYSASFLDRRVGVMEMYVFLQVVEERSAREWPAIVSALRPVDPESAADVASMVTDERRHVKYARAISRRYAPDEATLAATVRAVRAAEERAYDANRAAFMRLAVERDLLEVGPLERLFWRGLVAVKGVIAPALSRLEVDVV